MNSKEMRAKGFLGSVVAAQEKRELAGAQRIERVNKKVMKAKGRALVKRVVKRRDDKGLGRSPAAPLSPAAQRAADYGAFKRAQQAAVTAAVKAWTLDLKARGWKGRIGYLKQGGCTFCAGLAAHFSAAGVVRMCIHSREEGSFEVTCTPGEVPVVSSAMLAPDWQWPEGVEPECDYPTYKWTAAAREVYNPKKTQELVESTMNSMGWKRVKPNSVRYTNGVREVEVLSENYAHRDPVTIAERLARLVAE